MIHAQLLQQHLVNKGLAVLRSESPVAAWPVFVGHLPDDPDAAICVYATSGLKQGRSQRTGKTHWRHGFQIRVRASSYQSASAKIEQIRTELDALYRELVVLGTNRYIIHSITATTDVLPIGQESAASRRDSFVLNATITYEEEA